MEFSPEISGAVVGVGLGVGCVSFGEALGDGEACGKGEVVGEEGGEDGETVTSGEGWGTLPLAMVATSEYPRLSQKPK